MNLTESMYGGDSAAEDAFNKRIEEMRKAQAQAMLAQQQGAPMQGQFNAGPQMRGGDMIGATVTPAQQANMEAMRAAQMQAMAPVRSQAAQQAPVQIQPPAYSPVSAANQAAAQAAQAGAMGAASQALTRPVASPPSQPVMTDEYRQMWQQAMGPQQNPGAMGRESQILGQPMMGAAIGGGPSNGDPRNAIGGGPGMPNASAMAYSRASDNSALFAPKAPVAMAPAPVKAGASPLTSVPTPEEVANLRAQQMQQLNAVAPKPAAPAPAAQPAQPQQPMQPRATPATPPVRSVAAPPMPPRNAVTSPAAPRPQFAHPQTPGGTIARMRGPTSR